MGVPYFIQGYLWTSASAEATLKKNFLVEVNPPQNWPWKQNGTTVVVAVMILKVVNNRQIFWKIKSWLWNLITLQEMHVTITILEWMVSTWCECLTEIPEEKHLKLKDYLNLNLRSFGYFKCSTVFWLLLDPSYKDNLLTRVDWVLQAQVVTWSPK